jgi:hypothetical protein
MQTKGLALYCSHERSGEMWLLSDGRPVPSEIAALVIRDRDIAGVDRALFKDVPGQTFRFVEPSREGN